MNNTNFLNKAWFKTFALFTVTLILIGGSFMFSARYAEVNGERVSFSLTDQHGQHITQKDLAGQHLIVFFGFTSCLNVCPTQMAKITRVFAELDKTGHGRQATPVFISVDPERDKPKKIAEYLKNYDHRFVGLSGSRAALEETADAFKTLLEKAKERSSEKYQLTHSSIVYVVDPYSRVIDHISFTEDYNSMAKRIGELL